MSRPAQQAAGYRVARVPSETRNPTSLESMAVGFGASLKTLPTELYLKEWGRTTHPLGGVQYESAFFGHQALSGKSAEFGAVLIELVKHRRINLQHRESFLSSHCRLRTIALTGYAK
jgi:hypothetical protein